MTKDFFTLIIWAICGSICAHFAQKQGRSPRKWFFIGMLLGLFGLLILFLMRPYENWRLKRQKGKQTEKKEESPAIQSLFTHAPPDILWYYLDFEHQQQGPMSLNALENDWKAEKLRPSTWIWNEHLTDWKPLSEVFSSSKEEIKP